MWNIINPLGMILIYTLIFTNVMKAKLGDIEGEYAYSIYLCAGSFSWILFSEIVTKLTNVFVENSTMIKKYSFPRICLPIISIGTSLVNFMILSGLLMIFLWLIGKTPGVMFIQIIPALAILIIFATGIGLFLGIINVFHRDVGQGMQVIMQFWFWFTPIVYSINALPESVRKYISYNPIVPIIELFQNAVLLSKVSMNANLLIPLSIGILLNMAAYYLYKLSIAGIEDEL
jgi:lipopolysaccharide transport system permease protein